MNLSLTEYNVTCHPEKNKVIHANFSKKYDFSFVCD